MAKIGELNGPWAILLKVGLIIIPAMVSWVVWVSVNLIQGERFTATDALKLERRLDERIDDQPAQWYRDQMAKMQRQLEKISEDVATLKGIVSKCADE